uniref:Peptidase S9 prolyl oligopeptidase catalytic domain-containing protein n=1 Tax=Alexandrium monilatum TaxID=311494 RepID=A0A7S4UZY8_9DINO
MAAIEYEPPDAKEGASAFVLLLPGTSIRPGPGAEKAAKYCFEPGVPGIYRSLAGELSGTRGIPCLQLCWRHFPVDGGTTVDAVLDILMGIRFMRAKYGERCGFLLVGYSFGGAAVWAFLAECGSAKPGSPLAALGSRQSGLLGCIAISGALKGPGDDMVNLFGALQYLEARQAPALVVHGSLDDNVALSAAHKVFKKAASLKTLCVLMGADHDLREPQWRDAVCETCGRWLARVAAPRGVSNTSWARSVLLQHHTAAVALCDFAASVPGARLAFDPPPQRPDGQGPPPSYRAYEVPTVWDQPAAAARLLLAERCGQHAKRQQRAREQAALQRRGTVAAAHARLAASRERQASVGHGKAQLFQQCGQHTLSGRSSPSCVEF